MVDTVMDDMAKAGCECDNASDKAIQTCVERAATYAEMPTPLHFRAVHYHCVRLATSKLRDLMVKPKAKND